MYERNLDVEKWKKSQGLSGQKADEKIREAIQSNEPVGSVMEWTGKLVFIPLSMSDRGTDTCIHDDLGPGVFTDTILRCGTSHVHPHAATDCAID